MNQHTFGNSLRAAFITTVLVGFSAFSAYAVVHSDQEMIGPGYESIQTTAEEAERACIVRFAGDGLNVYPEASEDSEPLTVLTAGTKVRLLAGPTDSWARIKTEDGTALGYVRYFALQNEDSIVKDTDGLYTYEDMEADIRELAERYPAYIRYESTGTTADGRSLYLLTIESGTAEPGTEKKNILIHAGIHAREYLNCRLVMEQLETFLANLESGSYEGKSYRELLSGVTVRIVPMVNPDGITISQKGESGILTSAVLANVRQAYENDKSLSRAGSSYASYLRTWKANGNGVDLNRSFSNGFGVQARITAPSYASYAGTAAAAEAESANVVALIEQYHPNVTINYHSMGQIIYWDYKENSDACREHNRAFASYLAALTGYRMMEPDSANGGFLEWQLSANPTGYAATLETGSVSCPLPESEYENLWQKHSLIWPAVMSFALSH